MGALPDGSNDFFFGHGFTSHKKGHPLWVARFRIYFAS
jgi:hypothetical protein